MDAKPLSIGKILREQQRFVVPIYQRTYAWTRKKQLEAFMDQVRDKAEQRLEGRRAAFPHYMGALLVVPEGEAVFGQIQAYNIVDGQQRLTTFHLFYAALRDIARQYGLQNIEGQIAALITFIEGVPPQDRNGEHHKLQPTAFDRSLYRDLVDLKNDDIQKKYAAHFFKKGTVKSDAHGVPQPLGAWAFFREKATEFITDGGEIADPSTVEHRLQILSQTLYEDFRLIVITLSHDDDAQVIFETLNSAGEPLSAMDLVRNDVFHRAARRGEDVQALMEGRWVTFEDKFWKGMQTQGRIKKPRSDFYLGHTLAAELSDDISISELYAEYKRLIDTKKFETTDRELEAVTRYVDTYRMLVAPSGNSALAKLARRLEVFDVSTAYPLIFIIAKSDEDEAVKEKLYELIAAYIFRRAICGLTPKNYNKVFIRLASTLKLQGFSGDAFASAFQTETGDASRFPADDELSRAILRRDIYSYMPAHRLRWLLGELELALRGKFDEVSTLPPDLTVEHVLPQSWLKHWPLPDGRFVSDSGIPTDEQMALHIEERHNAVNTLGNLTLLTKSANPSLGKGAFDEKKHWLKQSLLRMNQSIAGLDAWDEKAIQARALELVDVAVKIWPAPGTGA